MENEAKERDEATTGGVLNRVFEYAHMVQVVPPGHPRRRWFIGATTHADLPIQVSRLAGKRSVDAGMRVFAVEGYFCAEVALTPAKARLLAAALLSAADDADADPAATGSAT